MTAGLIALLFSCSPAGIWQQDVRGFVDDGLSLVTMESHRLSRQGETAPLPRAIPDQPHTLRITLRNPRDFDLVVTLEVGDQGLFSAEPQLVAVDNRLLEVHFHPREDARDHQLAFRIDLRAPEIGRTFPSLEISLDCRYPDSDITVDIDLATPGSHGLVLTPNPLEAVQGQSVTVGLAGGSPLAGGSDWRWYLQGDVIAGQTGASLNLETADLLGDYNLGVSVVYEGVSYSGDAVIRVRQSDLSTCTVWYDASGGTGAPAESDHASGDTVTVGAAPSRSGYDFLGWQSDDIPPAPGGLHQPGDTFTMPPRSVWFTALWEAQEPADITVDIDLATPGSHGLVLTPNPLEAVQGQSVTVGLAGGSPLAGGSDWRWYLQGDVIAGQTGASLNLETADLLGDYNLGVSVVYEGVSYSGDAVIRVRQSDLSTCTVWYDSVGGTGAPAESDHASGDTVTVGAAPSRSGYDFLGWQSDDIPPAPGGLHQPGDTFTMPGNHVLFRASWEPDLLPVENLQGSANHVSQTLSLTWTDPDSPALEGIQVTWGPTGGSENGSFSVAPGAGSALIAGVTEPGVYHISVRAIYEGGGEAPEQTVQIQRVDYDNYSVGVIGPAGGVIFYEHDNPASAGWRFLEAAPRGWYGPVEDPRYEWIGGGNINPLMA
ncbi:Listeria/Bacterioides repeat-containing protein [Alkalispirochaeta americana]|uniref:Listeria/Bacterioides repeat-containing protein n=1 Tax=Alkalispirochaeta americana TaxID=159291 RepID=A0A1N6UJG8_9SPIO|nr:InlB B-repeat-containing protein [Alkalispirochaeta americana]SIQ65753.1 Listeria/Bacterioides repeat-containing protein [Alkalispirochaeta americana]